MTLVQTLWDAAWPYLVLLSLLVALRRQPPASLPRRVLGGILVGLVGVRVLACESSVGAAFDPREAYALLACLALVAFMVAKCFRLTDTP